MRFLSLAAMFTLSAVLPGFAEDGHVSQATLNALGLHDLQEMSDAEGMQIRGRITGNGMVIGTSLISGQLVTPDTLNFVNFSSINMISGDAQFTAVGDQITGSHAVSISPAITLNVTVSGGTPATVNYTYAGSVVGQVGGTGVVNLIP